MTDQLARILDGVAEANDRFARLVDNLVAEVPEGDFIDCLELADVMLTNRDAILWALVSRH